MTPRTKPAAERRTDLLDAAARVLVDKGADATTVDDITRAAGVSKGAFYLHFRSKQELIQALQQRYSRSFDDALQRAVDRHDDWGDKLDACVEAAYDAFHADIELHDALFLQPVVHTRPEDTTTETTSIEWLARLLADGVAAGAYRIEDVKTTAVLLFVAVHGFDAAFHGHLSPTREQLIRATQHLFRRTAGIGRPAQP
ncbi:putative transcriptional regulator, TetR family [Nocardia nova SH22a]|uniref:Putative transcriptional regulator, TetR family n=1 Tax=Nocardia nova SH22a TaxID=1415166 RepID=W5TM70_9NOCA|nr:TetR/AcrR family transcriptional regulator [Nocardia nova]AHH20234.1 putative transcriptional regulator, TetR family [Nocardia nova SH22a]